MGTRTARGANAGSLFPFLAVLICAMGALILLLLVTTRRIRQQQLRQSAAATATVEAPTPAEEPHAAQSPPEQPPAEDALKVLPPPSEEPDPVDEPLEPLFAIDPPPPLPDPNDAWRERLKTLEAQRSRLVSAVADRESTVARIRTAVNAGSHSLHNFQEQQTDADQQLRELELAHRLLGEQRSESHREAALLRRQIDESRERLADSSSKFTIMPFDGRRGTTRRPIIIECTDRGITFVSEGVTLGPEDLEGFNSRYNPLLAATRALTRYWDRTNRLSAVRKGEAQRETDPYVLLVVRPQGTIAYYVARMMLGRMEESFGYELVEEDQEFLWPESDATAIAICRSIVEQMLSERAALLAEIPGALSDQQGRFSDEDGRFWLDEVDELRNPTRQVTINGQSYRRDPVATRQPYAAWQPGATWQPGAAPNRDHEGDPHRQAEGLDRAQRFQMPATQSREGSRFEPRGGTAQESEASTPGGHATRLDQSARRVRDGMGDSADGSALAPPEPTPFSRFARDSRTTLRGATNATNSSSSLAPRGHAQEGTGGNGSNGTAASGTAASGTTADGGLPSWAMRSRAGTIGFEREVFIRVTATEVSIADETVFPVTDRLPSDELRRLFQMHLEHHIQTWDAPPRSFYWLPSLKFVVTPGGERSYQRLEAFVEAWKLRSTVRRARE